jgi:ABC-type sugar transport system ATPase subunit
VQDIPIVKVSNVRKFFPGVVALDDVSLDIYPGRVHVLIGENGAGKSTLFKIIAGIYGPDEGIVYYKGKKTDFSSPRQAIAAGIAMIHQELSSVKDLTVAENLFLGRELLRHRYFLDKKAMRETTASLLRSLGMEIDSDARLHDLKTAQVQMVEIAKAVSQDASVIIMDEPTSSISDHEVDVLFELIAQLKQKGVAVIYVSHRLKEIYRIGDTVTVLRDGRHILTAPVSETDEDKLVCSMVGRDTEKTEKTETTEGLENFRSSARRETVLEIRDFTRNGAFRGISFDVAAGEVFGLAGLVGSGRTEVVRAIFGADALDSGKMLLYGKEINFSSPRDAIDSGLGLVPEDRREQGILIEDTLCRNISLPSLHKHTLAGFFSKRWEKSVGGEYIRKIRIKAANMAVPTKNLSGGNQQKVVLAKWMAANSKILIMDEPTRGIDVGAKAEIYDLIGRFAEQGGSVIVVSSELVELLRICGRIGVMREGLLTGILRRSEATEEEIMKLASLESAEKAG